MIPRIKGQVGVAENGPHPGKWYFSLWVTALDGDTTGVEPITIGPWETEAQAKSELEKAAKLACDELEQKLTGKVTGKYLDMRGAELREWGDEQ